MRESMIGALSLSSPNNVGSMKQLASAFVQASGSASEISTSSAVRHLLINGFVAFVDQVFGHAMNSYSLRTKMYVI